MLTDYSIRDEFCDVYFCHKHWAAWAQRQFVMFFKLGNDKMQTSQISDIVMIVKKFVTKNMFASQYIFYD